MATIAKNRRGCKYFSFSQLLAPGYGRLEFIAVLILYVHTVPNDIKTHTLYDRGEIVLIYYKCKRMAI